MLEKLIKKCRDCNLKECIGCEITYSDVKELEKEFDSAGRRGYIKGSNATHRIWIERLKEIVDEHIPKQPNIITGEIEYTPNTNANSFLVQDILKLLEEK